MDAMGQVGKRKRGRPALGGTRKLTRLTTEAGRAVERLAAKKKASESEVIAELVEEALAARGHRKP